MTKPFLHSELAVPLLSDGKLPGLLWSQVPSPFRRVETNSDLFHCVCLHFVTSWHLSPVSPVIRTDLSLSGSVLEIGALGSVCVCVYVCNLLQNPQTMVFTTVYCRFTCLWCVDFLTCNREMMVAS